MYLPKLLKWLCFKKQNKAFIIYFFEDLKLISYIVELCWFENKIELFSSMQFCQICTFSNKDYYLNKIKNGYETFTEDNCCI